MYADNKGKVKLSFFAGNMMCCKKCKESIKSY